MTFFRAACRRSRSLDTNSCTEVIRSYRRVYTHIKFYNNTDLNRPIEWKVHLRKNSIIKYKIMIVTRSQRDHRRKGAKNPTYKVLHKSRKSLPPCQNHKLIFAANTAKLFVKGRPLSEKKINKTHSPFKRRS